MIPSWAIKLGAVALSVAALSWWMYDAGQDSKQSQMDALRQSYEVAAAQSAAREAERVRMWTQAMTQAGRQYDERAKIADSSFDASLDRLRNAYSSVKGVRFTAPATGECPAASRIDPDAVLRAGETVAAMARDADKTLAALQACIASHPR